MASRGTLSGLAVAEITAGLVFAWSGVENVPVVTVLRALATGHLPAKGPSGQYVASTGGATSTGAPAPKPPLKDLSGTETANRTLGQFLAATYGWGIGKDWQALDYGWGQLESGWNNQVYNGGTVGGAYEPDKAYGIPQALGHGPGGAPFPAGNAGNPPGAGGSSSPTAQILWGLSYIKGEYGRPSNVPGWLGQGGYEGY